MCSFFFLKHFFEQYIANESKDFGVLLRSASSPSRVSCRRGNGSSSGRRERAWTRPFLVKTSFRSYTLSFFFITRNWTLFTVVCSSCAITIHPLTLLRLSSVSLVGDVEVLPLVAQRVDGVALGSNWRFSQPSTPRHTTFLMAKTQHTNIITAEIFV